MRNHINCSKEPPFLVNSVELGRDDQLMQFHVGPSDPNDPVLPTGLEDLVLWDESIYNAENDHPWSELLKMTDPDEVNGNVLNDLVNKREVWITERIQILSNPAVSAGARPFPLLGSRATPFGVFYQDKITERILQNKPSIWELLNLSADAHVIHLHQVRFKILDRQDVGLSYNTYQAPTGMYSQYVKNAQ